LNAIKSPGGILKSANPIAMNNTQNGPAGGGGGSQFNTISHPNAEVKTERNKTPDKGQTAAPRPF
jgi:hypothetical protein